MLKKLAVMSAMMVMLSGCYMAPMALIGPATSGFTTASLMQSAISTSASHLVKKSTGKSISEHVIATVNKDLGLESLKQSYAP